MPYAELRVSIANGLQNEVIIFDNPVDCWENGVNKMIELENGLICTDCIFVKCLSKLNENIARTFYTRNDEPWLEMELEYFPEVNIFN